MGLHLDPNLSGMDDARCRRILRYATEAFLVSGYAATSVENIAIDASVSKLTIYRLFNDKLGLAAAVLHELSVGLERDCQTVLDDETPLEDCLVNVGVAYYLWMNKGVGKARHYSFVRLLMEIGGGHPELARAWADSVNRAVVIPLSIYLKKCIDRGEVVADDPFFIAAQFSGSVYHPAQSVLSENTYNKDVDLIRRKVQLFLRGCAVTAAAETAASDPVPSA